MVLTVAEATKIFSQFSDIYIRGEPWVNHTYSGALHLIGLQDGVPQTGNEYDQSTGCRISVTYFRFEEHLFLQIPQFFRGIRVVATMLEYSDTEWMKG
jgi:hypothetical protein